LAELIAAVLVLIAITTSATTTDYGVVDDLRSGFACEMIYEMNTRKQQHKKTTTLNLTYVTITMPEIRWWRHTF
jgi:hypothetical protein